MKVNALDTKYFDVFINFHFLDNMFLPIEESNCEAESLEHLYYHNLVNKNNYQWLINTSYKKNKKRLKLKKNTEEQQDPKPPKETAV